MRPVDTTTFRALFRSFLVFLSLSTGAVAMAQVSAYTFDQGLVTYSSISASGTSAITGSWDNNVSAAVPLNFTFNFNGTNYTDCIISSNGFITFGTTAPATGNVTPISTNTAYAGAISAYGMDLIRSAASDPIRYQTLGSSPNRTFVVEYFGVRRRYAGIFSTQTASDNINFQIRLNETSNTIEIRYGTVTLGSMTTLSTITCQVGLRGSANTQFNNRSTTDDWSATTAGSSNTASCQNGTILGNVGPVANQTFRWTPPRVCSQPTVNVAYSGGTSATVSWTCAGCTGPFVVERGPSTLLPGDGAAAGAGGTIVSSSATSPVVISGLAFNSGYKFAVRQLCSGGLYTGNSTAVLSTWLDCSTPTPLSCSIPASVTLSGGGGPGYQVSGTGCAYAVPGQEKLYMFTTTLPGVNRVSVTSHTGGTGNYIDYQWAPASGNCSQAAFTCIGDLNEVESRDFTLAAGTYYLLLDAEQTGSTSETFNIQCAAPPACIASPTAPANGSSLCQSTTMSWPAVTAFPAATGYDVYLDAGSGAPTTLVSSNQSGTMYTPASLGAGTYSWKVVPRNASGTASGCGFWTFTVTIPQGDRATNAITVPSLPATISGNNRAANCFNNDFTTTSTPGNPNAKAGRDVFYKVTTSPCTQRLSAGVCASSGGNSFLHLITQFGVNVANDDNTEPAGCSNTNSSSFSNVVVSPNTTYYLVVESTTAGNEFDFTLTISQTVGSADSDGDGTPDCADGCPTDPLKIDPGVCGCGFLDLDSDLDGVEDCFDECPTDPNKIEAGTCGCFQPEPGASCDDNNACTINDVITMACGCAGTPLPDTDGDGTCDTQDGCPNDANKIAPGICGCGVADTDTDLDGTADCNDGCPNDPDKTAPGICGCGVADTDTDLDGTADCNDGCPNDPDKIAPGQCGCGDPDTDTDGDGTADCNDGCPNDANKIAPGVCGCGTPDVATTWYADVDGDGHGDPAAGQPGFTCSQPPGFVANATDDCPSAPGLVGDACNDGNPFTTGDVLNGSCACVGTPVASHNWTVRLMTDGAGGETTWEIRDVPTNFLMASGGPYPNNSTINQSVSIPDVGHFTLRVFDSGNNGIGNGGGYLLRDHNGNRVIDNLSNGSGFASVSESPEGFFTPVGTDALRMIDCDNVERWPFEMIVANPNPLVSAQWQVGDQTDDGYEFWFTDPNGGYSRHVFRNHATSGGFGPANAQRACKLGLASFTSNPLPQNTLLNVRIRGRVNGANTDWGPVCRLKVDQASANCHTTQLENQGPTTSCGATGLKTNGSSRIWAKPVTRYVQATNTYVNANRYKFHFVNVGENTSFDIVLNSYPMLIYPQYPFQLGATYSVTVQASLDGGNTYCPVGASCQISFAATNTRSEEEVGTPAAAPGDLQLWPNPNRGDELYLSMTGLESSTGTATIDVLNMFGERVLGRTVAITGNGLNTRMKLDIELASGLYLVNLTADGKTITKRLVIQRLGRSP